MADFLWDYNFDNTGIVFVGIESAITAFTIGGLLDNKWWGLATFIIIMVLYGFPIFGGVFLLVFSFVEAVIAYSLLIASNTITATCFISLFVFVILVYIHRALGKIGAAPFGYSLVIFNALIISGGIYLYFKTPVISIILSIIIIAAAFIPVLRAAEYIILALGTAVVISLLAAGDLTTLHALLLGLLVLLFTGSSYAHSYRDYKSRVQAKKDREELRERNIAMQELRSRLYNAYPELEKQYYYFYTEVCRTEWEKIKFDHDWWNYLNFLDSSQEKISFNQYFDREKLYRTSFYNRDFAKQSADEKFHEHQEPDKDMSGSEMKIVYFAGVNNFDELKKRYRDLLKIYHPDNQNGDVHASQIIQKEYEFLLKKLKQ